MAPFNEKDWQIAVEKIKRLEDQVSSLESTVSQLKITVDVLQYQLGQR
jgi:phage shock protein A